MKGCNPLHQTSTGREVNASYSAYRYSKDNIGHVGISIFPGQDLGAYKPTQVGVYLVEQLKSKGVEAACFIHNETGPKGTSIDFMVKGIHWNQKKSMNISEAMNDDTIFDVSYEAKIIKARYDSNGK